MKATDARRHSPEKLEVLRERGFAMRREGFRVVEIAQALGVVRGTVYKWFRNAAASLHLTSSQPNGTNSAAQGCRWTF